MNVVDINRIESEILKAARKLVFEVSRCHAVTAAGNLFRARKTFVYYVLGYPCPRIVRWLVFKREEPPFCCDDDLIPGGFARVKRLLKGNADRALAALEAIVDRRIDYIAAQLDSALDRILVAAIGVFVPVTQIRAQPYRGQQQAVALAKVPAGGARIHALSISQGSCMCGFIHDWPIISFALRTISFSLLNASILIASPISIQRASFTS